MCLPQNVHLIQNYLSWLCETAECLSLLLGHLLSRDSAECPFTSASYREPRVGISTPVRGAVGIRGFPGGWLWVTAKMDARSLPVHFLKGTASLHEGNCRQGAASEIWWYDEWVRWNSAFRPNRERTQRAETTTPRVLWSLLAGRSDPAPSASCALFQPNLGAQYITARVLNFGACLQTVTELLLDRLQPQPLLLPQLLPHAVRVVSNSTVFPRANKKKDSWASSRALRVNFFSL